jgi:hypothetical protein
MSTDAHCARFSQLKLTLSQRAGTIRRSLISVVVLAAACLGATETARAYGAFALNPASSAWGVSWSQRTKAAAERAALSQCGTGCRVVLLFSNGCAGWAIDKTSGSTITGCPYLTGSRRSRRGAAVSAAWWTVLSAPLMGL